MDPTFFYGGHMPLLLPMVTTLRYLALSYQISIYNVNVNVENASLFAFCNAYISVGAHDRAVAMALNHNIKGRGKAVPTSVALLWAGYTISGGQNMSFLGRPSLVEGNQVVLDKFRPIRKLGLLVMYTKSIVLKYMI